MKTFSKILILLLLASCSSTKIIELGNKTSTEGINVSQKALDIYSILAKQADIDKSQQDELKVLTNPNPATMLLPDTKVQDYSEQLAVRIKAFKCLLNTYQVFGLLTDKNFGDKTKEAVSALQDSYNSINKLPDLPTTVTSKLPEVSKMITQAVQAKKIKMHNQILYSLTQLYLSLWNADEKIWDDYLDRIYNDYVTGMNTVDSKKYDLKQISQLSKEPYIDESIIILMYRLNQRDEIIKQRNDIKKQIQDLGEALAGLSKTHSEIAKEKPNISDVISSFNSIDNLLKQK